MSTPVPRQGASATGLWPAPRSYWAATGPDSRHQLAPLWVSGGEGTSASTARGRSTRSPRCAKSRLVNANSDRLAGHMWPAEPGARAVQPGAWLGGPVYLGFGSIRIGNPVERGSQFSRSEMRWRVPQAGHTGLGVVALSDDSGDTPAEASQGALYALRHAVIHRSSSVSGHLFAGHH